MSDLTKVSKTMSYILRHSNIETDVNGYVDINILLNHSELKKYKITFETIKYIVDNDNKSRYKFSDDNKFIRANQGHSKHKTIEIGKEIESDILFAYHGTSKINSENIMKVGLSRMNRQHIHDDVFSGIFYINAPKGSGNLSIVNPGMNCMWKGFSLPKTSNQYNTDAVTFIPAEGNFLLWPSYLPHSVDTNDHDESRISIAFNILLE
jgi:hypothetical protein